MRQALVWSKSKKEIDKNNLAYQINQTLMYGNLREIKKLIAQEGLDNVRRIFISQPLKIYTKQAFNFIKNYVLQINQNLDSSQYVKTLY